MFNLDHECPSLRYEQFALEVYTVPLHYGCVNIWTSKNPLSFELMVRWLRLLTPVTYISKLPAIHALAAFPEFEILRICLKVTFLNHTFSTRRGIQPFVAFNPADSLKRG
ncbi:hypothetical protein [Vagococcus sp. WN89Y]|uniref:hypothetical protein n=1 Tax=Vagococcus sp. WN89Y TaxID=3457258 RepID=UPI003FCCA80A